MRCVMVHDEQVLGGARTDGCGELFHDVDLLAQLRFRGCRPERFSCRSEIDRVLHHPVERQDGIFVEGDRVDFPGSPGRVHAVRECGRGKTTIVLAAAEALLLRRCNDRIPGDGRDGGVVVEGGHADDGGVVHVVSLPMT